MPILQAVLFYLVLCYLTFALYLAVLSLWNAKRAGKLTPAVLVLGWPLVVLGGLCDFALNMVSTLVFLDIPSEVFLTQRCNRYINGDGAPWRRALALWICRNMLDPVAVGGHCTGSQP